MSAADYVRVVESVRASHAALVRERAYASCADPRLRPIQAPLLDTVTEGVMECLKPIDIARRLRKQFPYVTVPWESWVGDEIVIAIARHHIASFADMGLARYDWMTAPDCCSRCLALAACGPYPVGAGPLPVLDSHSGCFCVLAGNAD